LKNNLLTEIKNIRNLMGLNEDSNDDCESKLEKAGYVVFNKIEQRDSVSACAGKERIKCVKKWMDDNGVDDDLIKVGSFKNVCYLSFTSSDKITIDGQELSDEYWYFWENGDLSHVNTFSTIQVPDPTEDMKFGQYRYQGKYICDNSELKSQDMKYSGVYSVKNYGKIINKTFMAVNSVGDNIKKTDKLLVPNEKFDTTRFK